MREISCKTITENLRKTILKCGVTLSPACLNAMKNALDNETGATRFALDIMLQNAEIAEKTDSPVCQDTGMAVVFAEIGQDVKLTDGFIGDAINEGVRRAYADGYFRKSVLDPIDRKNTLDNTPAVIHYSIVDGDGLKISVMLKGFGSENMSRLFMLSPSEGIEGVENAIVRSVAEAGGNPCPPVVVGVGIGGTMEKASLMSKHALLRETDQANPDPFLNDMEKRLTARINDLGVGAQGFGGKLTCMGVLIEKYPTHLAGLPVAVTMQCHAVRHGEFTL